MPQSYAWYHSGLDFLDSWTEQRNFSLACATEIIMKCPTRKCYGLESSRCNWATAVQLQGWIWNLVWDASKCLVWAQFKLSIRHFTAACRSVRNLKHSQHTGAEELSLGGVSSNDSRGSWTVRGFNKLSHSSAAVGRHGNCWNSWFQVLSLLFL